MRRHEEIDAAGYMRLFDELFTDVSDEELLYQFSEMNAQLNDLSFG